MRSLADFVYDYGYEHEWYQPIQQDFIDWFSAAYEHPTVSKNAGQLELTRLAHEAGNSAKNYTPDNRFIDALDVLDQVWAKIQTIINYLRVIAFILLFSWPGALVLDLPEVIPGMASAIGGILGIILVFQAVLHHQITENIKLIRKINAELVVSNRKLLTENRPEYKLAYLMWHRSLNKPRTIAMVVFLAVLRGISPEIYQSVNDVSRRNMADYIEEGVIPVSKREFRRLREGDRSE